MKVLFIARRFPPSIGGMERFAYSLSKSLPDKHTTVELVTWGGTSRLTLLFAIPWLFLRGLWELWSDRSIDIIHMQDAVLSPPGWLLSKLSRRPWVVVAHGLDLTFKSLFYQKVNIFFARRAAAMIAISEATANEARQRGIIESKISVVPLGADEPIAVKVDRESLLRKTAIPVESDILLTVGRLTRRKGVAWFIDNVLPKLPSRTHYVVIGDGTERSAITEVIRKHKLQGRVHLLGRLPEDEKRRWLASADIFVMPNIKVAGDMEGFGIVAHEAAMAGLTVVASNLEGIAQAIQSDKNGLLVEAGNANVYVKTLEDLLGHAQKRQRIGKAAKVYTRKTFGWSAIARQYRQIYSEVISSETEAS